MNDTITSVMTANIARVSRETSKLKQLVSLVPLY